MALDFYERSAEVDMQKIIKIGKKIGVPIDPEFAKMMVESMANEKRQAQKVRNERLNKQIENDGKRLLFSHAGETR